MKIHDIPEKTVVIDPSHNGVGYAVRIYLIRHDTFYELKSNTINKKVNLEFTDFSEATKNKIVQSYIDILCNIYEDGYTEILLPEPTLKLIEDEINRRNQPT